MRSERLRVHEDPGEGNVQRTPRNGLQGTQGTSVKSSQVCLFHERMQHNRFYIQQRPEEAMLPAPGRFCDDCFRRFDDVNKEILINNA